jgi:ubiquitin-activating enzyme E1
MSNLNRQFLFRKENVGHSKAECACKAVQKMNTEVKYESVKLRVCTDNEDFFNDDFWEGEL